MTTERAINQTSQTGRTATHDAPRSFLLYIFQDAQINISDAQFLNVAY